MYTLQSGVLRVAMLPVWAFEQNLITNISEKQTAHYDEQLNFECLGQVMKQVVYSMFLLSAALHGSSLYSLLLYFI